MEEAQWNHLVFAGFHIWKHLALFFPPFCLFQGFLRGWSIIDIHERPCDSLVNKPDDESVSPITRSTSSSEALFMQFRFSASKQVAIFFHKGPQAAKHPFYTPGPPWRCGVTRSRVYLPANEWHNTGRCHLFPGGRAGEERRINSLISTACSADGKWFASVNFH